MPTCVNGSITSSWDKLAGAINHSRQCCYLGPYKVSCASLQAHPRSQAPQHARNLCLGVRTQTPEWRRALSLLMPGCWCSCEMT